MSSPGAPGPDTGTDHAFLQRWRTAPESARKRLLSDFACALVAEFLPHVEGPVGPEEHFLDLGFDSLQAVDFKLLLEARLGCELQSTVLFDCPTPAALVDYLERVLGGGVRAPVAPQRNGRTTASAESNGALEGLSREELSALCARQSARLRTLEEARSEPIAIVGIGCRFPGHSNGVEAFWRMLEGGVDAIAEVPPDRWDVDRFYDPDPATPGRTYARWGGWVDQVDRFDARLFGISPREAIQLDPQQRAILEVTWEALEEGGLSPEDLRDTPVGVYIGTRGSEYFPACGRTEPEDATTYFATGNSLSTLAGRISYSFGWTGPCYALDTACSSSLVAVHAACQALRRGECSAAVTGGVNLMLDPFGTIALGKASLLSPDGRCKTFDARGNGYVRSEGVGVIVIKRLSRALADGDRIHALIRGSAINQDGASGGLTVPNGAAQEAVIRLALADGGLEPDGVDLIEAHGTGTSLGDPIEVAALDAVFSRGRNRPLVVGSIKTNIGHGECVAGIGGLIKLALSLERKTIPRHLHLQQRNPHIPWDRTVIRVPTATEPWEDAGHARRGGVSSFGFSGTNAHVVLEEPPVVPPRAPAPPRPVEIVAVSAHLTSALERQTQRLSEHLAAQPQVRLDDVAYTLAAGRTHLAHRRAFVVHDRTELDAALATCVQSNGQSGVTASGRSSSQPLRIGMLFTGQGSQQIGMGRELYEREPVFREALDRCAAAMQAELPAPLLSILWGDATHLLDRTDCTQPALFAIETALAALWESLGIHPTWVLGHSIGEYAAGVTAGVFELEDAARIVCARGRLMVERTTPGSMLAVFTEPEKLEPFLRDHPDRLAVAAWNCDARLVLSGASDVVEGVARSLGRDGVRCEPLKVSHAFHSPLMEPMLAEFEACVARAKLSRPRVGFVSNLEPGPADEALATSSYWARHVREPVRFQDGMQALEREGVDVLLEVGPAPVLLGMAKRFVKADVAWLPSMRPGQGELERFATSVAELYVRGAPIDWRAWYRGRELAKVALPTYSFEPDRFWLEKRDRRMSAAPARGEHALLGSRHDSAALPAGRTVFGTQIAANAPEFLSHHEVFGRVIVPAAALFDQALAACRAALSPGRPSIRDVTVSAPLVLEEPRRVETVLSAAEGQDASRTQAFELYSAPLAEQDGTQVAWTLHARGTLESAAEPPQLMAQSFAQVRASCAETLDVSEFYGRFDEIGLGFGPAFRSVVELSLGDGEALARVALKDGIASEGDPWILHGALLDSCFQCSRVLALQRGLDDLYLPVGVEQVIADAPAGSSVWCHARLRPTQGDGRVLLGDLDLYDSSGRWIASVRGLQGLRTSRAALLAQGDPLKALGHVVSWIEKPRGKVAPTDARWLVVGAEPSFAEACVARLQATGATAKSMVPGTSVRTQIAEAIAALGPGALGLGAVGIAFLAEADSAASDPLARQRGLLGTTLELVHALEASNSKAPRLALVTRGATPAGNALSDPSAATVLALGATIALEHPDWTVARVDLDSAASADEWAQRLTEELAQPDGETQIAWRGKRRFAARLQPRLAGAAVTGLEVPKGDAYRLVASEYGQLEKLALAPVARRAPGPGEVEVRVKASALNFKDVLATLGLLREITGIERASEHPLGLDCAGEVAALGPDVSDLRVGDEVLVLASGCFSSHVTVVRQAVVRKPFDLDLEHGAGLPTVYLTVMYGLERLAKIQRGERVLIHAAAGGVGQAAVLLCKALGAEVFATASPSKWAHLRAQGVEHVFHSRTLDFERDVLAATNGEGVDVVLNSLTGEAIGASLRALKQRGRFVEIGRRGIWSRERMFGERPDVAYHPFDLTEVLTADLALFQELLVELAARLESGELAPLPTRTFALSDAVAAFRWMTQSRQIGKLVLRFEEPTTSPAARGLRPDGTYLVTGGLGALGLHTARWLVEAGARHLCLMSRRPPNESAQAAIAALEQHGASVRVAPVDVGDRTALGTLIDSLQPPIAGVVHAAGVLDDGVLANQTWERFAGVLGPKLAGAAHLHELTLERELDLFVCYSSMAAMLGAPGQGPYVAANAYLDALCHQRRELGLAALALDWGPWSGGGMASATEEKGRARFAAMGLGTIAPEVGIAVLARLASDPRAPAQVGVLPVTWSRYLRPFGRNVPPFFEALAPDSGRAATQENGRLRAWREAPVGRRRDPLLAYLRGELARVLGFPSPDDVDPRQPLIEMGVDSLLAVDLKNRLESDLERTLAVSLVYDHPTLEALADHLSADESDAALLAEIEAMSEDEAALLMRDGANG
jgi:acyl transferase domain-containing protein/NADPH-dependent curcumin reductase CurA/acyl carrier protein